jgi:undecaprenyl diphosphate synthase
VAIIMDGNGRWAESRRRPRVYGHIRGATRVKQIVTAAKNMGIQALTLFAFSTENWSRPEGELRVLWKVLEKFLKREVEALHRQGIRLRVIGEIERLDPSVRAVVDGAVERLKGNTAFELVLAISYGSQTELARAARLFAEDVVQGKRRPDEMTPELLETYLWTGCLGSLSKVDLLIRTSGEMRVSNFLLWQSAYAELLFVRQNWPDFTAELLAKAVREYGSRERRFGNVPAPGLRAAGALDASTAARDAVASASASFIQVEALV